MMERWLAGLGLGMLLGSSVSWAHPPGTVELSLQDGNKVLLVRGDHAVQDPVAHRISQIQVLVNGKEVANLSYDRQRDLNGYEGTVPMDGLKQGDTIEAKVTCSKFGAKSATRKVETLEAAMPETDSEGLLLVGSKAPLFRAKDQDGKDVVLEDLAGKRNVVLVFYPKDKTPGCTKQLCAIRDDYSQFSKLDAAVFGVNPGSAESHKSFASERNLPFPLLVDEGKSMAKSYGTDGTLMITRTVYGIDKEGKIVFAKRGMPSTQEILSAFQTKK